MQVAKATRETESVRADFHKTAEALLGLMDMIDAEQIGRWNADERRVWNHLWDWRRFSRDSFADGRGYAP